MIKSTSSTKYLQLLEWLKEARLKSEVTMRDLAGLIDEPHQFISKIETAERRLDVYEYVQYCRALNLDPAIGLKILDN